METGGAYITSYDLRYIESETLDKADANWTLLEDVWVASAGGDLEYAIVGLVGGTQYDVQVRAVNDAGDGPWSNSASAIAPVNHMPMFAEGATATRAVAENSPEGSNIGDPVTATDDDSLTYTLGGADAASFTIDGGTGQLMTKAALDFETRARYTVIVTASDGTDAATVTVTITVTNVGLDDSYDANDDGMIDSNEVLNAVEITLTTLAVSGRNEC